jgi:uncharacterized protein YchJ
LALVSEFQSMVGFSPLLLWACGEAVHHGGEYMAEETAYLMAARRHRYAGNMVSIPPSTAHPNDQASSHQAPPHQGSATSQYTTGWGPSL